MPPPPVQFTFRLKPASLSAALKNVERATGKCPALLTNKAVFSIANRARKAMPVASAAKISAQLQESKAHVLVPLKNGRFSRSKKNLKSFFNAPAGAVPILALIVNSRANRDYSGPYELPQSPFKGVSRAEGAARMLEAMRKVFRSQTRSIGYFRLLAQGIMQIFRAAATANVSTGKTSSRRGNLFDATIATGTFRAVAKWWVRGTIPETKRGKDYLRKIAEPIWQRALEEEAASMNAYAIKKEYAAAMKAAGIKVT